MAHIEKPIQISSDERYPSNGSVWIEVGVDEFLNACSDEELNEIKTRLNTIANPQPVLRKLSEEEIKKMGLPPIPIKKGKKRGQNN